MSSHAKCVNNQGTKLDGINVQKDGSMVIKYFSSHSQNEGKVYTTKIYHYLLMTRLACDQLLDYFMCHDYVPVFYHKSRLYSTDLTFSQIWGLLNVLETAQNFNIQFIVPLPWNTITTRTTIMPAFWGYPRHPMITHTIDPYGSQVKTRQSKS